MLEVSLAISSALFYALTYILSRLAAEDISPIQGAFINSATVAAIMLPWSLFTVPVWEFLNPVLLWFVGIGVFIPGLARMLHYAGLQRIGASPAALIRGVGPLFSSSLAVLLLGETLSFELATGTGFIILGVAILSIRKEEMRSWALSGIVLSLAATMTFVFRDIIIRHSSPDVPYKTLAILVMSLTSTVVMGAAWGQFEKRSITSVPRRGIILFVMVGISTVFAQLALFHALDVGRVVVVTPIIASQPLFVMLLSVFLPRGMEKITMFMILGGAIIVLGGTIIGIG
ncbi:MAG: DMT family transporter [Nitrospinaceae bacterium]|nr:DMT family transporter [Nitrospinaceae bacterium]MBT3435011.1 DMT family transporter [Nitrospinaceae bacterium]MBT3821350.1 DMT family transporter [Nitrospinaceae bacterium]MBT4095073.1 DMT family transporter [Nitrospinaceae bacterium]MBT4432458.1 DMT family transporter [Nitrospinaceae bacterium]